MPDAPMPGAAAPAAGEGGGGVAEAIVGLDSGLSKLAKATLDNPQVPDSAKAKIQAAVDAFRAFTDELTGGGGEEPAPDAGPGTVPAMAGAGGVPVSHGRPA